MLAQAAWGGDDFGETDVAAGGAVRQSREACGFNFAVFAFGTDPGAKHSADFAEHIDRICTRRFSAMRFLLLLPSLVCGLAQAANEEAGSQACAGCHAGIYRKYSATGMARTSGRIGVDAFFKESFDRAAFSDPASGAEYRIVQAQEGYRLEFARSSAGVQGQRILEWFVGSGSAGRSYLFSVDGFLFQSPVSYYSSASKWDLSPGYQKKRNIDLTRAVETACLQCHASRLQPAPGSQNGFGRPPFLEGGVSCQRCHGPGGNHIARMRSGGGQGPREIVNPAKLDPARRDSVCAQCHLTGAARVARIRHPGSYHPGNLLSDYVAVFVWSAAGQSELTATSHYERLQQSACKKASGDRLWCGSCHDPHEQPAAANRAGYYRGRRQARHQRSACTENPQRRRNAGDDCAGCHLPKSRPGAMEHLAFTDHAIPRRPIHSGRPAASAEPHSLTPVWTAAVDDRDIALAYAVAAATEPRVGRQALHLLQKAEARGAEDPPVLSQLAQFYDRLGNEEDAMRLCERILRADPSNNAAAINLGIYWIKRGRVQDAMRLWEKALLRNPALTGARVNLAVAQYRSGDSAAAEVTLRKALEYDPDAESARKLLAEIEAAHK